MSDNTKTQKERNLSLGRLREIVAISVWSFALVKLFIYDVDVLIATFAGAPWLAKYKFFFIFGSLVGCRLLLGNKRFWLFVLYVVSYPLTVLFWKIPKIIFKKWEDILVLLPGIVPVLKSLKSRCITWFLSITACLLILLNLGRIPTALSMFTILICLGLHFWRRLKLAFAPSLFFGHATQFISRVSIHDALTKGIREADKLSPDSEEYSKKRSGNLYTLLLINHLCIFFSRKIKRVQESHAAFKYPMVALTTTFLS
ncbi:MAG: hypothetical protein IH846_14730, partial [Acidobacteria bacterium]|nr:hypothetical protein [Acidobacteriota bacterium]